MQRTVTLLLAYVFDEAGQCCPGVRAERLSNLLAYDELHVNAHERPSVRAGHAISDFGILTPWKWTRRMGAGASIRWRPRSLIRFGRCCSRSQPSSVESHAEFAIQQSH